jgi:hypothetical protein
LQFSLCYEKRHVNFEPHGVCVDLPAKAIVVNMKQFDGFYGCIKCDQKRWSTINFKHHYNIIIRRKTGGEFICREDF